MEPKNPKSFYTKVPKSELKQESPTLSNTGLWKRQYYSNPHDPRLRENLSGEEVIVEVPSDNFCNTLPHPIGDGVWESGSPVKKPVKVMSLEKSF